MGNTWHQHERFINLSSKMDEVGHSCLWACAVSVCTGYNHAGIWRQLLWCKALSFTSASCG